MSKKYFLFCIFCIFFGCHKVERSETVVSMQVVDRNGFSETISNKDRLNIYQNVNFLASQPYQKVLRVYKKDQEGKSSSKLTSYHANGGVWQYLEAVDGRAHGRYLEWHENGKIKIEAHVIEGLADLSETSQTSWLFDKECVVWDEQGNCIAEFLYDKGLLIGDAKYYFPNHSLQTKIPYTNGLMNGTMQTFNEEGEVLEEVEYKNGKKDGKAFAFWTPGTYKAQEQYRENLLLYGIYFDLEGNVVGEIEDGQGIKAEFNHAKLYRLISHQSGVQEGEVQVFDPHGNMHISYQLKSGKKTGEEWEYYLDTAHTPKLLIQWYENQIQGMVKTWFPNGRLESQKEMAHNKKHGLSFAYYSSGDLMMMEEYENDQLIKGSYYKKGSSLPISQIENGEGTATFYNAEGYFIQKVPYEKGKPAIN